MSGIKRVVAGLMLGSVVAVCGYQAGHAYADQANGKPGGAERLQSAEEAGWELVFTDTFDREELGENWEVVDGKWEIDDGALRGSGVLISAKGFPEGRRIGFQRLEFKAVTDVKPIMLFPNQPKPEVTVCDISSFIHAQPPGEDANPIRTGYFFQFGGFNNTRTQILKLGTSIAGEDESPTVITPDKVHHVVAQNDEGTLQLFVDGELVLEHEERMSVMGENQDRVGFYFYTAAKVLEASVYVKKLPDGLDIEVD